jgi:hypothetical protein
LLSACATAPAPEPQSPSLPVTPSSHVHSSVLGLTASELVAHLGQPALQVREGSSLKMQFRNPRCVLDAYLYPPASGAGLTRVTHSDARLPSGADTDQAACISAIEASK